MIIIMWIGVTISAASGTPAASFSLLCVFESEGQVLGHDVVVAGHTQAKSDSPHPEAPAFDHHSNADSMQGLTRTHFD